MLREKIGPFLPTQMALRQIASRGNAGRHRLLDFIFVVVVVVVCCLEYSLGPAAEGGISERVIHLLVGCTGLLSGSFAAAPGARCAAGAAAASPIAKGRLFFA